MRNYLKQLYWNTPILREEDGQDLIEYVLIIAVMAFAATIGMTTVSGKINTAFANIGTKVDTYAQ
jgi:pilus assembly protein Flp/PilA